jgi:peptidyl-prolyl cis-trans isomerase D
MIRFLQTPGPFKKVILSGILLIFCGAMVITLIPGGLGNNIGFGGPSKGVVATVSGEPITSLEVQKQAKSMLKRQFPGGSAQSDMLLPFFASQAAETLISEKAVLVEAANLGLHVSDDEVKDELQHGRYAATFFPGGKFIGQEAYESLLQQNDLTVPMFEENLKNQILFEKLQNMISGSAMVTDAEVRQEFEKRNTKVKFEYAVLSKDEIQKGLHPGDAELKAFYESHKAAYNNSIPEKRKVRYAVVDTTRIQAETKVPHEELQAYYDQHRDEYRVPEQVNVRQVLLKTPLPGPDGKVDPKAIDETRKKAEDVLKQLKAGAKFEDIAKKYSEDPSAKNGGSLGLVQPSRFPSPDVQKAAASLAKGATSDVINAGYAFVILHIDDKQEAHLKTVDEVKDQIEPILKQQKATRVADAQASALLAQVRTAGIEKAAADKGLQVVNTDFVGRTDALPGIGNAPAFMDAVFNAAEKTPPDQVQLPTGYAVYEVVAIKPPATPSFDDIRSRVETEFKNERTGTLLSQKTQELSDRAKAGHDLKKAAKELGAAVKTSDLVLPDGQVPDVGSMAGGAAVAFTLKTGEISGPIESGNNGIVLSLLEKQEPTDQDFAAKKDQIRDSLLQAKQGQLFGLFVSNLRDQMEKSGKIKINQEEMKALTKSSQSEEGE